MTRPPMLTSTLLLLYSAGTVYSAASCLNGGFVDPTNSQNCICLPGFAGPDCSRPRCGGNPFESPTSIALNLSSGPCSCPPGWTGTGCNVCTEQNSCNAAFLLGGFSYPHLPLPTTSASSPKPSNAANNTLVCNTDPFVFTTGLMSCNMNVRQ